MNKALAKLRCFIKSQVMRVMVVDCWCDQCGGDVQDFYAPDYAWEKVAWKNNRGGDIILCYNCFSKLCWRAGLHGAWALVQKKDLTLEQRMGFNKFLGKANE